MKYGDCLEVYELNELPHVDSNSKFFVCIGGEKNYQCFYESKKLSRGEFLDKYAAKLDSAIDILYEDEDIIIRQDIQFAIPGFYIIATKQVARRIRDLEYNIVEKCYIIANLIKDELLLDPSIQSVFVGYDEHYKKPTSTHFWILPIYEEKKLDKNLSVQDKEFWNYFGYSYQFKDSKQQIHNLNMKYKKLIDLWMNNWEFLE